MLEQAVMLYQQRNKIVGMIYILFLSVCQLAVLKEGGKSI
jgi:hypothetical protein